MTAGELALVAVVLCALGFSGAVGRGSRGAARTTLSVPMIEATGLATGTSRAVSRLRRGA